MVKKTDVFHYIVKEFERSDVIFKKYDSVEEAVKHCIIYTNANEGKPVRWWVLSTNKLYPDGFTLDSDN